MAFLLSAAAVGLGQQYTGIPTAQFNYVAASQQQDEWCWAASIQMILNYYRVPASQAEIVQRTLGVVVDAPGSDAAINSALNGLGRTPDGRIHAIRSIGQPGAPPPGVLLNQLNQRRPVLLTFVTGPNSGHAVVATAASYVSTPAGPQITSLVIRDPWPSSQTVPTDGRVEIGGLNLAGFAQSISRLLDSRCAVIEEPRSQSGPSAAEAASIRVIVHG